jgi:hypothetical protein
MLCSRLCRKVSGLQAQANREEPASLDSKGGKLAKGTPDLDELERVQNEMLASARTERGIAKERINHERNYCVRSVDSNLWLDFI